MPIITTLEMTRPSVLRCRRRKCSANHSCARISPVLRLRLKPWWPVEQKRQPTAQPACDDTHSVPRSSSGMNTVSTALPPPTSNSHLIVPSADACSLATASGRTSAAPASLSRSDLARSVICAKSDAPLWWIQRNSWVARKRFSPSCSQYAVSPFRSKSSRLTAFIGVPLVARGSQQGSAAVDIHRRKEERDLHRRRFRRVGSVHGVRVDAVGEVGADGALLGLLRVGGAHQLAALLDRVVAFSLLVHDSTPY